jgi:signal transduction histidine kinase/CheY-like chemotaxis protein
VNILIVEDDHISRKMLCKVVDAAGYEVFEAENGLQAWEKIKDSPIDCVITDWMMPAMDGLELCRRVRQELNGRYVYIIMLTAKDDRNDLVKIMNSGADDYIAKPFFDDELRSRLQAAVRLMNMQNQLKELNHTIAESRNKLLVVFDSLQEEIVALDHDLNIVSANYAFMNATGCGPDDFNSEFNLNRFKDLDSTVLSSEKLKQIVFKVFDTGQIQKTEIKQLKNPKSPVVKKVEVLPIIDDTYKVFQVVIVIKDLSEDQRKTLEIKDLNKKLLTTSSEVEKKNKKLVKALNELEDTQAQMLQSEKMASIGQLAAGIAHEINNPTGYVSSNLKSLGDYNQDIHKLVIKSQAIIKNLEETDTISDELRSACAEFREIEKEIDIDYLMEDSIELIDECKDGIERVKKIVIDLKDFAHPGEDQIRSMDINAGIESTLNVVNNEIKYKASVVKELGDIPTVHGYPQQLNQVFMNIFVNAAQAIEEMGEIRVSTKEIEESVEVKISDTGTGITPENLTKIFDPFFTTKEVGKGTGLGMNIAYNIIQKHRGTIDVSSVVGEGTTFTILLPVEKIDEAA